MVATSARISRNVFPNCGGHEYLDIVSVYLTSHDASDVIASLACACIHHSCWFQVTPMPEDVFEIAVKREARHVLQSVLDGEWSN